MSSFIRQFILFNMNLYDENNERKQCVEGQEKESIGNKTQVSWFSGKHLGMIADSVF